MLSDMQPRPQKLPLREKQIMCTGSEKHIRKEITIIENKDKTLAKCELNDDDLLKVSGGGGTEERDKKEG